MLAYIEMKRDDNGVETSVWLNKSGPQGEADEVRVFTTMVSLRTYMGGIGAGTHTPLAKGPRYRVIWRGTVGGAVVGLEGQTPTAFALPGDLAALNALLSALP